MVVEPAYKIDPVVTAAQLRQNRVTARRRNPQKKGSVLSTQKARGTLRAANEKRKVFKKKVEKVTDPLYEPAGKAFETLTAGVIDEDILRHANDANDALIRGNVVGWGKSTGRAALHMGTKGMLGKYKRKPVSEYQGGKELGVTGGQESGGRSQAAAKLREEEMYNLSRTPKEEQQRKEEMARKEQDNKDRWNKTKFQQPRIHANNLTIPDEYEELSDEAKGMPEMQEAFQEFEDESLATVMQDRGTQANFQNKMQSLRKLQNAQKNLAEKSKKTQEQLGKTKRATGLVWTGGAVATEAENELALLGTASVPGKGIPIFRFLKGVLKPKSLFSPNPDDGQFFKGFLSVFEPTAPSVRDGSAIIITIHAAWGFLWYFAIMFVGFLAITLLVLLVIFGAYLLQNPTALL